MSLMGTCSEINVSDRPRRKSTVLTSWSMRLVIRAKLALHLIVPVHHKVFAKEAVLVMSMLSQKEKRQVQEFLSKPWALKYRVRLEENVDVNTTHVITKVVKKDSRT